MKKGIALLEDWNYIKGEFSAHYEKSGWHVKSDGEYWFIINPKGRRYYNSFSNIETAIKFANKKMQTNWRG